MRMYPWEPPVRWPDASSSSVLCFVSLDQHRCSSYHPNLTLSHPIKVFQDLLLYEKNTPFISFEYFTSGILRHIKSNREVMIEISAPFQLKILRRPFGSKHADRRLLKRFSRCPKASPKVSLIFISNALHSKIWCFRKRLLAFL